MYGHDRTPFKKLLVAMVWGASEAMQGKLLVLLIVGNSLSSGVASFGSLSSCQRLCGTALQAICGKKLI